MPTAKEQARVDQIARLNEEIRQGPGAPNTLDPVPGVDLSQYDEWPGYFDGV